jgi:hypothetical protein
LFGCQLSVVGLNLALVPIGSDGERDRPRGARPQALPGRRDNGKPRTDNREPINEGRTPLPGFPLSVVGLNLAFVLFPIGAVMLG